MRYTSRLGLNKNKQGVSIINTILIVLIVFCTTASGFFYISSVRHNLFDTSFQVVVLDTGEVFFGTVEKNSKRTIELTNVYYLPIDATDLFIPQINSSESFSVIKIGNELHGPEDSMYITKAHIVFIQNLKEDSRIVAAIEEYQR